MSNMFQDGGKFFNRIYLAQIEAVHEEKGTVDVVFLDDLLTERNGLELPWSGFSKNGHRSSWIRYMPQVVDTDNGAAGDIVYVGFSSKGEAYILGYATPRGHYAAFLDQKTKNPSAIPRGDLTDLRQGEWDMRSSGGAYIFGAKDGSLLLAAGPQVRARLNKQKNEARLEAGLWDIASGGSFMRVGDVKRKVGAGFSESSFTTANTPVSKEYWLHIETPTPIAIPIYDENIGAVCNGFGVARTSDLVPGVPLRVRRKVWAGSDLIVAYSEEVDAAGNHKVDYGATTTNVEVNGGPVTAYDLNMRSISANATLNAELTAGLQAKLSGLTALVEGTSPIAGVQLGGATAHEQVILGTTYMAQNLLLWTQLAAVYTSLAVVLPKMKPQGLTPAEEAAFGVLTAAVTALGPLYTTLVGLAAPPAPALLSLKVLTE